VAVGAGTEHWAPVRIVDPQRVQSDDGTNMMGVSNIVDGKYLCWSAG
jgi:hypothetical protein